MWQESKAVARTDSPPLFVYGTLRRGQPAHHLLQGAEFVGTARVRGRIVEAGGYPALAVGDQWVTGELYRVNVKLFARLDDYEGKNYQRKLGMVIRESGGRRRAWIYYPVPPIEPPKIRLASP
jgi:gamma-glutamylcyclotransferase (GGCT)/AIG2-like uncharacterized protein YtfP